MGDDAIRLVEQGAIRSSQEVNLSFGDVELHSTDAANIVVGDRSIDFFFDPNNFPISYDGTKINMEMHWAKDSETMVVQRLRQDSNPLYSADSRSASSVEMDVSDMTKEQKMTTLLYLIGKLMNDGR